MLNISKKLNIFFQNHLHSVVSIVSFSLKPPSVRLKYSVRLSCHYNNQLKLLFSTDYRKMKN